MRRALSRRRRALLRSPILVGGRTGPDGLDHRDQGDALVKRWGPVRAAAEFLAIDLALDEH
ncbi:hypothetical protein ABT282_08390 [Streptomyces sp. NPDC000927]|uniref:hypothetical protein n=1 Tax=Streptomyces sp. NPDC000927 TaxID=3154371 RepID=UPI00332A1B60